jgi:hypothetical protein
MENLRAFAEQIDWGVDGEEEVQIEVPPDIGFDERRMHVRAYNYWVSLLNNRAYPSIEDLEPEELDDFGPHSVLLDFTSGPENPSIAFLGRDLREQCALDADITTISQVPSRSLLSRLTDHYLQIIANCAPIGFEAEFLSDKGVNTMYRGILMPLSSDGDTIDFIYGVINWKELADSATTAEINDQIDGADAVPPPVDSPIWADGPTSMPEEAPIVPMIEERDDATLELGLVYDEENPADLVEADQEADSATTAPAQTIEPAAAPGFGHDDNEAWIPSFTLDENSGLADRLSVARESADAVKSADSRSRLALYSALSDAYDFALAAEANPDDYAEILEDSGLKAQERAPMTPIVKLIFGIDYDKTRLTEFAAALSYARRQDLGAGELRPLLERFEGGLKGIVAVERWERRPNRELNPSQALRAQLREADPIGWLDVDAGSEDFVLLVARREADGRLAVVAPVRADAGLIDRAIRKSVAPAARKTNDAQGEEAIDEALRKSA